MERNGFSWIDPSKIKLGDFRVRTTFDEEKLEDLKRSIKRRDLLAPIVVKDNGDETFTLIAGERRLIASKELGLAEVPVIIRKQADADSVLIEMGVENIQREDLSYYERGRWVQTLVDKGWTITSLADETGLADANLSNWLEFFRESERIKKVPTVGKDFEPEKLPLRGLLATKRAPIPEQKKTELVITASKLEKRPTISEIQRATRIIEQEPETTAEEAIERARGITYLLPVPSDLMPSLQSKAEEWDLGIQETIIKILREYLA